MHLRRLRVNLRLEMEVKQLVLQSTCTSSVLRSDPTLPLGVAQRRLRCEPLEAVTEEQVVSSKTLARETLGAVNPVVQVMIGNQRLWPCSRTSIPANPWPAEQDITQVVGSLHPQDTTKYSLVISTRHRNAVLQEGYSLDPRLLRAGWG